MGRIIVRELTTSYDTVYGAFTGSVKALENTRLTLVTIDGPYSIELDAGITLRMVNVPVQRINIDGRVLVVGEDHPFREYIAPLIDFSSQAVSIQSAPTIESILDDLATEYTLSLINVKLSQPNSLQSKKITIDNSAGTEDLVVQLFSNSTPSKYASLYRDPLDDGDIYLGDSTSQEFPLSPGDVYNSFLSDLSLIYVRIPTGKIANIYVLWEV